MGLNFKRIFLLYFNHLKLLPWCSGIKRVSRKQPLDSSICCSSNQRYVIRTAALQQLFYPSSRDQDEHTHFVKYKQNAFSFREQDNSALLLNMDYSKQNRFPVPFGCSYVSHGRQISHQATALMPICRAPAVEVQEPAGAGTPEQGCKYTQVQRGTGERQPRQVTEKLRDINHCSQHVIPADHLRARIQNHSQV